MALYETVVGADGVAREVRLSTEAEAAERARWAAYQPKPVAQVTAAQAEMALYDAGLYDAYVSAVALHPYQPIRIWAAKANVWERKHPYIAAFAAEIGLTEDQIDTLFLAASKK